MCDWSYAPHPGARPRRSVGNVPPYVWPSPSCWSPWFCGLAAFASASCAFPVQPIACPARARSRIVARCCLQAAETHRDLAQPSFLATQPHRIASAMPLCPCRMAQWCCRRS